MQDLLAVHRLEGDAQSRHAIVDRLFLPMLLEAIRVLDEGIVRDPADIDAGSNWASAFPPPGAESSPGVTPRGPGRSWSGWGEMNRSAPGFSRPTTLRPDGIARTRRSTAATLGRSRRHDRPDRSRDRPPGPDRCPLGGSRSSLSTAMIWDAILYIS